MSAAGNKRPERRLVADAVSARRRAEAVSGLRGLRLRPRDAGPGLGGQGAGGDPGPGRGAALGGPEAGQERCDMCGIGVSEDHRHLLQLAERRIICACEACWAMRAGEGDYRPVGNRTLWLEQLDVPDDLWASFQIPIGLAFFMESTVTACVVAMYPSPGGATESELHFDSWHRMVELNPALEALEPDIEGLIVNRLTDPPLYVIAPIDRCYELTGTIKAHWEGISGGTGVEQAVAGFFARLKAKANAVPA